MCGRFLNKPPAAEIARIFGTNALGTNSGYVNVHTANFPNGEIRGHIKFGSDE
jgi:hypothetical protein